MRVSTYNLQFSLAECMDAVYLFVIRLIYREWYKIAAAAIYVHIHFSGIYTLLAGRT